MIASIQALRGIAALAVLLYHTLVTAGHNAGYAVLPANTGASGVDLFFVISGFVLTLVHYDDFEQPGRPVRFLRRRLVRVVPMYWLVTTVIVLLLAAMPGLFKTTAFSAGDALASYLFIISRISSGGTGVVHAAGWTLCFEMFFYLLFFIALAIGRRWLLVGIPVVFLLGMASGVDHPALQVWTSSLPLEFVLGVWIGAAVARGWRPPLLPSLALAALAVGVVIATGEAGLVGDHLDPWRVVFWGLPMAAIVTAAIAFEQAGLKTPRLLAALGASSYSLYLLHILTLPAMAKAWHLLGWQESAPLTVFIAVVAVVTIAVSHLFHLWVEVPVTRRLNQAFA